MKISILGLMLLSVAAAWAQGPGMFPWWEGPIRTDLGLSDDQNRQINDILRNMRPRLMQLRRDVVAAESELKQEMDAPQVDLRRANDAVEKVVAARSEMMRTVSQMSVRLRLILSGTQWQELQKRQPRPGGQRRMHQPGTPPPPGAVGEEQRFF